MKTRYQEFLSLLKKKKLVIKAITSFVDKLATKYVHSFVHWSDVIHWIVLNVKNKISTNQFHGQIYEIAKILCLHLLKKNLNSYSEKIENMLAIDKVSFIKLLWILKQGQHDSIWKYRNRKKKYCFHTLCVLLIEVVNK